MTDSYLKLGDAAERLNGRLVTDIDICYDDEILITLSGGRRYKFWHRQDCCETVEIVGVDGDVKTLRGKIVRSFEHEVEPSGDPPPEHPDSWTRTTLRFVTDENTVIVRWLGTSNGYYSENVDFSEISRSYRPKR